MTASWSSLGRHLSTLDQRFQKLLCQVASLNALMVHVNITFKSRLIYLPEDLHRLVLNILNTCKKLQSLLLVEVLWLVTKMVWPEEKQAL